MRTRPKLWTPNEARPIEEMPAPEKSLEGTGIQVMPDPGRRDGLRSVNIIVRVPSIDRWVIVRLTTTDLLLAFGRSLAEAGRRVFKLRE